MRWYQDVHGGKQKLINACISDLGKSEDWAIRHSAFNMNTDFLFSDVLVFKVFSLPQRTMKFLLSAREGHGHGLSVPFSMGTLGAPVILDLSWKGWRHGSTQGPYGPAESLQLNKLKLSSHNFISSSQSTSEKETPVWPEPLAGLALTYLLDKLFIEILSINTQEKFSIQNCKYSLMNFHKVNTVTSLVLRWRNRTWSASRSPFQCPLSLINLPTAERTTTVTVHTIH